MNLLGALGSPMSVLRYNLPPTGSLVPCPISAAMALMILAVVTRPGSTVGRPKLVDSRVKPCTKADREIEQPSRMLVWNWPEVTKTLKLLVALKGEESLSVTTVLKVLVVPRKLVPGVQLMMPLESIAAPEGASTS